MGQLVRYQNGFRYLKYGMSTNFVFASSEISDETVHLRLVRYLPNFPELALEFWQQGRLYYKTAFKKLVRV